MSTLLQSKTSDLDCDLCGNTGCAIPIYKEFALKYENTKEENNEALELTDDALTSLTIEVSAEILVAKKKYLKHHRHQEEEEGKQENGNNEDSDNKSNNDHEGHSHMIPCKFPQCHALQKMKSASLKSNVSLNCLNELEQAHLTFSHSQEFDKYWRLDNRSISRSNRYTHKPLSNDDINDKDDIITTRHSNNSLNKPEPIKTEEKLQALSFMAADLAKSSSTGYNEDDEVSTPQFTYPISSATSSSMSRKVTFSPTPSNESNNGSMRKLLNPPSKLKYTKSVRYQKLLINQHKKKKPAKDVILFGYEFIQRRGKYKNPKQEVLQNNLLKTKIKISEWNNLLRSCSRYVKIKKAKDMKLTIKEIVGLKLYTDFDELQREYRKCFRIKDIKERLEVQEHFVHWNDLLINAYKKAQDKISTLLYHGVSLLKKASTFNGKYYGPVSTTTIIDVAKQFSGDNGIILIMHSSYNTSGIKLSWLSNYPDEDEVLYMNVTFQITDIIDPKTEKSIMTNSLIPKLNEYDQLQLKNALQNMSVNSNVLSLNSTNKNELSDKDLLSIISLLYLQYKKSRWQEIVNKNIIIAETLSNLREQFIELIEKVKAVQMDDTSPLIQDFFSTNQKHYKFPFSGDEEKFDQEMKSFNTKFNSESQHFFRLQTIIRLFPEAEEIAINAENFDFSLHSFVEFLEKWRMDYSAVALKYIDIKFNGSQSNKYYSDQQAIDELEKNEASGNISRLLRLGWAFLTPSTLSRVPDGFKPKPELPFLLTFIQKRNADQDQGDNMVFYRRYTQEILQRNASHKSLEGFDDEPDILEPGSSHEPSMEGSNNGDVEIYHNPKVCVLSTPTWGKINYQQDLKKLLGKAKGNKLISPKGPGSKDNQSFIYHSFSTACDAVRTLDLDPLPKELIPIFMKTEDHETTKPVKVIAYEHIYSVFQKVCDIFLRETEFNLKECQRLCSFLSTMKDQKILPFERIFYKEKEIKEKSDPINQLKKSPSMFIFLEDYDDDEDESDTKQKENDDDYDEIQQMTKMLNDFHWCFQPKGQIAFCKSIYEQKDDLWIPSKVLL